MKISILTIFPEMFRDFVQEPVIRRAIEKKIADGDKYAKIIYDGMLYQIAKYAGAMATAMKGKVDAIILTGGIAYSKDIVAELKRRCEWIAPFTVYPGEDELLHFVPNLLIDGPGVPVVDGHALTSLY